MTAINHGGCAPLPRATPVLETRDVRHSYGRRAVLKGVSFVVEPGTLIGIVGENGSGKSTLLRILAGELHADAGTVVRRAPLGYCPQSPVLNEALSVDRHLAYFAAAYGLGLGRERRGLLATSISRDLRIRWEWPFRAGPGPGDPRKPSGD